MSSFRIYGCVALLLVLLSAVLSVDGSSSSTSTTAANLNPPKANKKPIFFASDRRTGVTGFGARSSRKSIFRQQKKTKLTSTLESAAANLLVDTNGKNHTSSKADDSHLSLWVHRSTDPDILWLQKRDPASKEQSCIIKTLRVSTSALGEWQVESSDQPPRDAVWVPIEGIYGMYPVPSGVLWVLITKSEPVLTAPPLQNGDKHWWQINKVKNLEVVHLGGPNRYMLTNELKEELRQVLLLRKSLKQHALYFCPRHQDSVVLDMTKNLQQSIEESLAMSGSDEAAFDSFWWNSTNRSPDPRFFWNQVPTESLVERHDNSYSDEVLELLKQVIPVTSAFVGSQSNLSVGKNSTLSYSQVLISRRSRFRAGTRFTKRGADASGAVANYAETEQVCLILGRSDKVQQAHSHVQIRGSIPLHWSSPTDIKTYRPRIRLGTDPLAQARAMRLHLVKQLAYYSYDNDSSTDPEIPKLIFVNLIDKHSDQGRLGRAFDEVLNAVLEVHAVDKNETAVQDQPKRRYSLNSEGDVALAIAPKSVEHVWFDFHAEVKGGRWDRLKNLLESLEFSLVNHRFFSASAPTKTQAAWQMSQHQNAIVRTNCMDCLDRTNVVQSLFGRYMLFHQLATSVAADPSQVSKESWKKMVKKFKKNPLKLPWEEGEVAHRLLWADNADAISRLYAGTPALKGDFTRTGKRTRKGALDDGMNSLQRYYLNNFLDAARQEGMDLLVGYISFSNTGDQFTMLPHEGETTTAEQAFDFRAAARQSILGDVLEGLDASQRKDIKKRLGDVDITGTTLGKKRNGRKQLDFRWLPGDLQMHLVSQASQVLDDENTKPEGSTSRFCPQTALESIDRRSSSDDPWWYLNGDDSDNSDGDDAGKKSTVDDSVLPSETSNSFHHPRISASHMLLALVVGIKAPIPMAVLIVALIGLAFLPDLMDIGW